MFEIKNETSTSSPHKIRMNDSESSMKVTPANGTGRQQQMLSNAPVELLNLNLNQHPFSSKSNQNRSIYTDFCDSESQLSSSQKHQKTRGSTA